MGILDEDVTRVRDATDLVALASEHLALKRVGSRMVGLCPFHAEKTPSFSVNPEIGRFYCLAGETRVMTWDGPRPIRELAGTTQRILSTHGRWIDAPFFAFGVQALMKLTVGRNLVTKVIHATPEHRWFVRTDRGARRECTTSELRAGDPLSWTFPRRGPAHRVRPSPQGVVDGINYGRGARLERGAGVDLHRVKGAARSQWFPMDHEYRDDRAGPGHGPKPFVEVTGLPASSEARPSLDESAGFLVGWLAGYFAADGCVAEDGTVMLDAASRDDLEFVRLLCTRAGIGTYSITERVRRGFSGRTPANRFRVQFVDEDLTEDFFLLREHRARFVRGRKRSTRRGWVVKSVEATERVEEVYCAVVPGEHAFALEDNILTGNCFGCQASGDAITFVREVEHLDFVDAVERLASRAGITLRYDDKAVAKDRTKKQRLSETVAAAIIYYHSLLLESADGGLARRYLRSRGFDGDAARQFQLGWSPDAWDHLSVHLQKQKLARDDIVDSGLAFVNKANKLQDHFRGRLMFPIFDSRGEAVGFGGRALGSGDPRKYINSPETPIYQKSRLLYGLNWAKGEIVGRGEVVICEGYTDVMAFALAGAPNAVATCGTALADDHFQILKNLARKVVLAYDSDAAGQGAAEKWYGWEQRYEIQLQVADLPAGRDPADVWHDDPQQLMLAIERAAPFLQFRLDRVLGAADLATLEGRARAAETGAEIVAQHPSDLVRDQYVMKLAGSLDIDADRLRETVARHRREGATTRPAPGAPAPAARPGESAPRRAVSPAVHVDRRELDVLLYAVHEPELVVDWIDARLFVDPIARAAFEAIASNDDFHVALAESDGEVRDLLERLAVEEPIASDEPETLRAHLMANTIGPAAQRVLTGMLRAQDDRATSVKLLLDALAHAREVGDWEAVQERSIELLGWIGEGTRGASSVWKEAP